MQSSPLVGIDLGGTAIKAGALGPAGEILGRRSVTVPETETPEPLVRAMADLARELARADELGAGVGIGSAGLIDSERGVLVECPNIKSLEGVPLRAALAQELGLPESAVQLENDANAAALGESRFGAARGEPDTLVVTLGTGVGGGLIQGGRILRGTGGMAGELGHVMIDPVGAECACGARGCLETLVSATAARRRARQLGLITGAAEEPGEPDQLVALCARARAGAGAERELLSAIGRELGLGLAICVILLDLRHFVVGGGFGAALDLLLPGVRSGLAERILGPRLAEIRVVPAELGADAGWIGAASLLRD